MGGLGSYQMEFLLCYTLNRYSSVLGETWASIEDFLGPSLVYNQHLMVHSGDYVSLFVVTMGAVL